ncbi:hypothetical protein ASPVEDRAFT_837099 [Aspergillus versicolor CBS 583.65]|uniref:BTB domain-containing protein n=1 Tax=Aspergillus versicolor CBS 583.65 TaxID=1036611 RepID=A0A1L9PUK3_ASPVE|nr:uncharacterized protein ASPVEDRAFT_837099 [Aspergillus versicolor CBS 583.65]OJJ05229.1 hypothetical protein ASPVEDRAFT_837099 [Aspergillus versicolor CBS 583.65]
MAVQIDPDGDILVNCSGTVTFLVSKKALSLASPVLTWMVKPPVEGGLAIKNDTSTYPIVSLPHQDPEAFRVFGEVVHHKSTGLSDTPTPRCLRHIAYFIDEYNCTKAMAYSARVWLSQTLRGKTREELWDLLRLAYVVNLGAQFYDISRELLWISSGRFGCWEHASQDLEVVFDNLLGFLNPNYTSGTFEFANHLSHT